MVCANATTDQWLHIVQTFKQSDEGGLLNGENQKNCRDYINCVNEKFALRLFRRLMVCANAPTDQWLHTIQTFKQSDEGGLLNGDNPKIADTSSIG